MPQAILHLDTESTWRGGENQLRLLLEHAPSKDWLWHVAAPPASEVIRRLSSLVQTVAVPMRGLALLTAAWKLAAYVRRNKIVLIDCQSSRAHNLGLLIKLLVPSCRLVVHRRVDYPPGRGWIHRKKYLSSRIDAFVCISEAIAQVLKDYGVPETRLHIVRSAVDPKPFEQLKAQDWRAHWRSEWNIGATVPIIGNVAYLTEQKDHATLLKALGRLKQEGIAFFCYIAGDGPLAPSLKALAQELNLGPDKLRFLGVRRDVPELLAATDIFALSSQDEGLGTSLLDATHSSCALVATAAGGIPEIVEAEVSGLLVPVGDATTFADQLRRVLLDPSLRQRLVAGARKRAIERFSLEAMVEGNLKLYTRLLSPSRTSE